MRTDLANELAKPHTVTSNDICKITRIQLSERQAKEYNKAAGTYTTIETRAVSDALLQQYSRISKAVAKTLLYYYKEPKTVLVVGLGNPDMTADALGSFAVNGTDTSSGRLFTVKPGVTGATGVESYDLVKGLCERLNPSLVLVIDSLAAASVERVCNVVQFSDGGITPGSGVSNHRKTLSKETLGVPVVSIGVPLVVYATTIINEVCDEDCKSDYIRSLIVTPKDIDILVRDCGRIIADGINLAYTDGAHTRAY